MYNRVSPNIRIDSDKMSMSEINPQPRLRNEYWLVLAVWTLNYFWKREEEDEENKSLKNNKFVM